MWNWSNPLNETHAHKTNVKLFLFTRNYNKTHKRKLPATDRHRVNSKPNLPIPFLPRVGTPSTYLEYLLQVVYIPSRIVMEEIFLN